MGGTMNTQASEFPQDPDIFQTGTTNADEFRDLELTDTAVKHKADFSSVPNEKMQRPVDGRGIAVQERRSYANDAVTVVSADTVSELGTRRYGSLSVNAFPGTGGYAGAPVLLLGEDRSRVRFVLSNAHDTDPVRVGQLQDISNGGGMALPPGVLFETNTTEPIYACVPVDALNMIPVGVWAEYA